MRKKILHVVGNVIRAKRKALSTYRYLPFLQRFCSNDFCFFRFGLECKDGILLLNCAPLHIDDSTHRITHYTHHDRTTVVATDNRKAFRKLSKNRKHETLTGQPWERSKKKTKLKMRSKKEIVRETYGREWRKE